MKWISVETMLPEHGQHVIVWEDRFNVYPFPRGSKGDDGDGRARMGDAIFFDGDVKWKERNDKHRWSNDKEKYKAGNRWHRWEGQGPCSFHHVVYWMPMPEAPETITREKRLEWLA